RSLVDGRNLPTIAHDDRTRTREWTQDHDLRDLQSAMGRFVNQTTTVPVVVNTNPPSVRRSQQYDASCRNWVQKKLRRRGIPSSLPSAHERVRPIISQPVRRPFPRVQIANGDV